MIILDTNVLPEPMKPNSNPVVQAWLDRQTAETLYLTATSLSELLVGIEILPDGKRKEGLDIALKELMAELFGSRILSFNQQAALAYAPLISRARNSGCLISVADGQIAAIAIVHGFTIATMSRPLSLLEYLSSILGNKNKYSFWPKIVLLITFIMLNNRNNTINNQ